MLHQYFIFGLLFEDVPYMGRWDVPGGGQYVDTSTNIHMHYSYNTGPNKEIPAH